MAPTPFLLALALFVSPGSGSVLATNRRNIEKDISVSEKPDYKRDCWLNRPVSLAQGSKNVPGAGIEPFTMGKVYKDGFMPVGCYKDYMYSYGDKFGDNKFSYKLGKTSNVSIVLYSESVKKLDQKPMDQDVCFRFCRSVPNMGFFGIVNGRDCYCTPYYKTMESDSSNCDAVCEGDPSQFCGGRSKSSVFGMHSCANTGEELADAAKNALALKGDLEKAAQPAAKLAADMAKSSGVMQKIFGEVGDSATTNLMQSAKVFAGKLEFAAEDAKKTATKLGELEAAGKKTVPDLTNTKDVSEAEKKIKGLKSEIKEGKDDMKKLEELKELASPPTAAAGVSKQYYPVMYFVDKAQKDVPQTCGGDVLAKPIGGGNLDSCAAACDKITQECVGFSFYEDNGLGLCFLFSKLKTAFYYTGCGGAKKFMFAQSVQSAAPFDVKCMVKFSKFDGTTLKPDPSGKCKMCLKKATKADRCYSL